MSLVVNEGFCLLIAGLEAFEVVHARSAMVSVQLAVRSDNATIERTLQRAWARASWVLIKRSWPVLDRTVQINCVVGVNRGFAVKARCGLALWLEESLFALTVHLHCYSATHHPDELAPILILLGFLVFLLLDNLQFQRGFLLILKQLLLFLQHLLHMDRPLAGEVDVVLKNGLRKHWVCLLIRLVHQPESLSVNHGCQHFCLLSSFLFKVTRFLLRNQDELSAHFFNNLRVEFDYVRFWDWCSL